MKYILSAEDNGINFDAYASYLATIENKLPPHIFEFASNPKHYDLTSVESLHDSWLERFVVHEISGGTSAPRKTEIYLALLGPFQDRLTVIRYTDVSAYSSKMFEAADNPRSKQIGHGNLYTHEITLTPLSNIRHELLFELNSNIVIECKDFTVSWEKLNAST